MDRNSRRIRRRTRLLLALVTGLALASAHAFIATSPAPADEDPTTVVSFTFDDANANQKLAETILDSQGMAGTFYVPSGYVGSDGYLTLADLEHLKAGGHEIGGHTVSHANLTTLSQAEAIRQVCDDRVWLTDQGFQIRSFAYPFAAVSPDAKAAVESCGYNSARGLGDLRGKSKDCSDCPWAESIPPTDPFETKAPEQVESSWKAGDLKKIVSEAEKTGGWVQFTFHNVCVSTCELGITTKDLEDFVDWLAKRTSRNTVVKTVGDVIGGAAKPAVRGPAPEPPGPGVNGVTNPSMEEPGTDGAPACWMKGGYGSNVASLTTGSPGRTGTIAGVVTVSNYANGDAKWLPRFDLGQCSPSVAEGHTYSLRAWYEATGVTQYAVYLRDASGLWHYWTSSPWFAPADTFAQAVWTTPEIPEGYTALSFGLNVFNNGSIRTDDYALYDTNGAPPAAEQSASSPSEPEPVQSAVEPQPATGNSGR